MSEPELMSRAEVEDCLKRAGLSLSVAEIDGIHQISGYLRAMLRRIGSDRPMEAEPASTFRSPVA
ncbi:MAG: hypothetical protein FJX60_07635 [Alphaproteobacteria bacterium]|nr:hypothetical protein [Alphaproteobacteria bacterium]